MQGVKLLTCAMTRIVHHDMLGVCYLCMAYACGAGLWQDGIWQEAFVWAAVK